MKNTVRTWLQLWLLVLLLAAQPAAMAQSGDSLPSWNDGAVKQGIEAFVRQATTASSAGWVPGAERIAVFDNDGTLWSEQPMYFQFLFALDQVKAMAPAHPEWKTTAPFDAVLAGDVKAVLAGGDKGMAQILMATHTGMDTEQFSQSVSAWVASARHPRSGRPFTDMVYQPMLELLALLRENGFKIYIVSGGTVEFMRAWSERVYGIPPEQVIGTSFVTRFDRGADGRPVLRREAKLDFLDDGPGKPVAIQKYIGRRPVFAFGNSDGDLQMLQWTAAGPGARFMGLVHHTDGEREWAYDRASSIGRLDKALDEATARRWTVVDMKRDWKRVYPFP
ncbi:MULTISPECIES: HAD family hydrolase [Ramlibacter]|uniref:Haloacid dehalogenase-like hydrolase n=1 Tax=Ramlibacter pinisoli TaxID=2682844 RepID=A0A6N8IPE7_9BURK|nr:MULTISPECIES: HAD family hydrolase [Ramlibacter]MBA2963793.1 haloacid dehalogenase-like hydrolase [Ramlibacter sp. CGMCC 1.13660]MVQ28759.1 haloacid dehalogenase-like hydrolase [Ramlibacter pinisoli]